jgi:hypothetical protein
MLFRSRSNPSVYNTYSLPIGLPFLGTEAAYELFNDMAIAPSSDITPNMLTVILLPIVTVPFAGVLY